MNGYYLSGTSCLPCYTNCFMCSTALICTSCNPGYYLNSTTSTCSSICGDGMLVVEEDCDDSNTDNGDGCSSTCTIEQAYFCEGNIGNTSNCSQCALGCLNCTALNNCSLCESLYTLNDTECIADCSVVAYCSTCGVNLSTAVGYV